MAKKRMHQTTSAVTQLRQELQDTAQALRCAYDRFNYVSDPELVEASVYEISSLKARYNYLLRRIKEQTDASAEEEPSFVAASSMRGGGICRS
ncbi:MAG: DUF2508 family protein [Oscillospiraceae bacterium]|nr:DUF2508 family protein [Oscillospiraceae bacterium]